MFGARSLWFRILLSCTGGGDGVGVRGRSGEGRRALVTSTKERGKVLPFGSRPVRVPVYRDVPLGVGSGVYLSYEG